MDKMINTKNQFVSEQFFFQYIQFNLISMFEKNHDIKYDFRCFCCRCCCWLQRAMWRIRFDRPTSMNIKCFYAKVNME